MMNKEPEHDENELTPQSPGEGDKLQDVLHKSKLQISVLKKILKQIPVNPQDTDTREHEQAKENQNP